MQPQPIESTQTQICSICQREFTEYGNEAYPVNLGRCCATCNARIVIPARLVQIARNKPRKGGQS